MKKHIVNRTYSLTLILLGAVFFSCDTETTVDLETPNQRLVVEGRIEWQSSSNEQNHKITLSTIGDFFKNETTPRATGADVWVTNSNNERYEFQEITGGEYVNNTLIPQLNAVYTLHIIWNSQEYEAVETLMPVAPIDSIYQRFEEGNIFEDEGIKIAIDFIDPVSEDNYYFWETYRNGALQVLPDPGNKNNLIAKDEFFDGRKIEGYIPNEETVFAPGEEVLVKQLALSENAYDYYFILFDQAAKTGALIDTPPVPVRGNIQNISDPDNYALGYFYASQVSEGVRMIQ